MFDSSTPDISSLEQSEVEEPTINCCIKDEEIYLGPFVLTPYEIMTDNWPQLIICLGDFKELNTTTTEIFVSKLKNGEFKNKWRCLSTINILISNWKLPINTWIFWYKTTLRRTDNSILHQRRQKMQALLYLHIET